MERPGDCHVERSRSEKQKQYLEVVADQTDDFSDLGRQAEQLAADYRTFSRLWSPQEHGSGRLFVLFSAAAAVFFILSMLVPYAVLEWSRITVGLPKYLFFILSFFAFAALYLIGVFLWLRKQCAMTAEYVNHALGIVQDFRVREKEHVNRTLELYGELLPEVLLANLRSRQRDLINRKNDRIERQQEEHERFVEKAYHKIREIETSLKIRYREMKTDTRDIRIDYNLAPWSQTNLEAYFLFPGEGRRDRK